MSKRSDFIVNKIVSLEEAIFIIRGWELKGDKVVFTNGCFDILHRGHVSYLAEAASYGQRLVVGLNSDSSIRQQGKGKDRPVNEESDRAFVLAGLGMVDLVILFSEDTPFDLIQAIKPAVLAKGADYDPNVTDSNDKKYIVGSDIVRSYGGEVVAIPFVEGHSTTNIISKLKD